MVTNTLAYCTKLNFTQLILIWCHNKLGCMLWSSHFHPNLILKAKLELIVVEPLTGPRMDF